MPQRKNVYKTLKDFFIRKQKKTLNGEREGERNVRVISKKVRQFSSFERKSKVGN
jgi:hypothetical protein